MEHVVGARQDAVGDVAQASGRLLEPWSQTGSWE